ncbi:MAG: putative sulfate exporter family transporter [Acidobacteria bacterium]|nr:putative sulfate exporter family transporter [Acidobacteriota bacterium]
MKKLIPGIALSAGIMLVSLPLADLVGRTVLSLQGIDPAGKASPISGVLVAIIIGITIRNLFGLPASLNDGIRFSVTRLLRLGIIFIGIRLSFFDVVKLGGWGIPVVATSIVTGLLFITWFNKSLHLPERLGTLIAAGTSICGVTAIVSTAPAIKAEEKEVAYAVANVTVFGLVGMFVYPYLARVLLTTSEQVGLFLGTAVHETAQVVGAAITYTEVFQDPRVLQAATVTKLTRNLFLAIVVPILSFYYMRNRDVKDEGAVDFRKLFPVFVLGFVVMAVFRSVGDALWNTPEWKALTAQIGDVWGSRYLLGTAMAGVGLGTSFSVFRGVGLRPFLVGLVGALLVGLVGFAMAFFLGQFVHL